MLHKQPVISLLKLPVVSLACSTTKLGIVIEVEIPKTDVRSLVHFARVGSHAAGTETQAVAEVSAWSFDVHEVSRHPRRSYI